MPSRTVALDVWRAPSPTYQPLHADGAQKHRADGHCPKGEAMHPQGTREAGQGRYWVRRGFQSGVPERRRRGERLHEPRPAGVRRTEYL